MTEYKKPAQVLAHESGQGMVSTEKALTGKVSSSPFNSDSITEDGRGQVTNCKFSICDLLPAGACNAVSRQQLMASTGLSARELRRQIAVERRNGALIMSTTSGAGGYYRPADVAELQRFVQSMTSRGRATFAAVSAARRLLREMDGGE